MFLKHIIMNLYLICVFSICLHYITCAPSPEIGNEKTFYDAIIEKCPSMNSVLNYKYSSLFKTCKDLKAISEVKNVTADNHDQIRCLLYFETFTSYCIKTQKPDIAVPKAVLVDYDLKTICAFVKMLDNENLKGIFQNEENCKKICSDDLGFVDSICGVSYYFAHVKVTSVPQVSTDSVQPVNQSSEKESGVEKTAQSINNSAQSQRNNNITENKEKMNNLAESALVADVAKPKAVVESDKNIAPNISLPNSPSIVPSEATLDSKKNLPNNQQEPPIGPVIQDNSHSTNQKNVQQSQKNEKPEIKSPNTPGEANLEENNVKEETVIVNKGEEKVNENQILIEPQNPQLESELGDDDFPQENEDDVPEAIPDAVHNEKSSKPLQTDESESEPVSYTTEMDGDSYFFTYFMVLCIVFIAGYVCYHNKQKILALILEGRRGKRQYRGRRPNSANYHKLDSNLEEAINSSCKKNTNNVIY